MDSLNMELVYYVFMTLLALLITKICFFKLKPKGKNLPPSPLALPLIGHLHLLKKPIYRSLQTLAAKHGPILFLKFGSRPVLIISSPSAIEECFTKHDILFANRVRADSGKHLSYSVTWAPYGDHWRNLRKITAVQTFSTQSLQMSASIRFKEVLFMVNSLFDTTKTGSHSVELKTLFSELVFNVIMKSIAGKRCFDANMTKEEKKRVLGYMKETFVPSLDLGDFFPTLKKVYFRDADSKMIRLRKVREIYMQELVDERRRLRSIDPSTAKNCLIDNLLLLQESEPDQYSDNLIKGLMLTMLTAGTETTALTMEWAMTLLVNHPEVLDKSSSEIQRNVQPGKLLDESDLPKLPYLNSIINETLRLYPVAPLLLPHFSSKECTVGGYTLPCGTMLLGNAWALQRDPNVWVNPNMFIPQRFEGETGEKMDGFKFIPFGVGRRSCPGLAYAMRMVGVALGTLIQCFEWERIGEEQVDMSEGYGITLSKIKPLVVKCKPRLNMINVLSQLSECQTNDY